MNTPLLAAWLGTYAVHSTLFLLGAAAADRVLSGRFDRLRETLWKGAMIGALLTATLGVGLGGGSYGGLTIGLAPAPASATAAAVEAMEFTGAAEVPTRSALERAPGTNHAASTKATPTDRATPSPETTGASGTSSPVSLPPWTTLIVWAWLLGAAGLVARILVRHRHVMRVLRGRQAATDDWLVRPLAALMARVPAEPTIRLSVSHTVPTPVAIGFDEIVVPPSMRNLPAGQVQAALAHELAHLRRGDPAWRLGSAVLESIFFFQPLHRVARRRLEALAERLADAWAVRATGSPIPLARCLTAVAAWTQPGNMASATAWVPMVRPDPSGLGDRIVRLLDDAPDSGPDRRRLRSSATLGVILLVGALAPSVQLEREARVAGVPASPPPAPESATPAASTLPSARADTVVRHPDPSAALQDRWAWAVREGSRERIGAVWVVFRVPTRTRPNELWTTGPRDWSDLRRLESVREQLRDGEASPPGVYVMLRIKPARDGQAILDGVFGQSVGAGGFDFEDRRVFWLGPTGADESLDLLSGPEVWSSERFRERLVDLIGVHDDPAVEPFLLDLLGGPEDPHIRAEAAEGLARHPSAASVEALATAALGDGSADVRAEAAEALGDMRTPSARAAAIRVAQSGDTQTRSEAVESLGAYPDQETVAFLERLAEEDPDGRVGGEAVETLSQMNTSQAHEAVRRLAWDGRSERVRREAVEALGQRGAEAAPLLEELAFASGSRTVARQAAESLAQLPADVAVPALARIVNGDVPRVVARQAAESLGDVGTARALDVLRDVVRNHPDKDVREEASDQLGWDDLDIEMDMEMDPDPGSDTMPS